MPTVADLPPQLAFQLGAIGGVLLLWFNRWRNKEIECVFDMMWTRQKATLTAMASQCAIAWVIVVSQPFKGTDAELALAAGLGIGTAIDAWLNKGERKEWSEEEREKVEGKPKE